MMTYPEIYYSDDVKRILNSKPPLPDAPKEPEYVADPRYPTSHDYSDMRVLFLILFVISIVLFVVGFFINQEKNLISSCSFVGSIVFYIIVRVFNNKVEEYKWDQEHYKRNIELRRIYKLRYAEYKEDLEKYNETIETILTDENIDLFRKRQIKKFLTKRSTPKVSDCDTDKIKKGLSEMFFATLLSKEFSVYTNKRIKVGNSFFYPDILLIHNNIYIDIEIDEPYSNDDGTPIHYICKEKSASVDDDRNEYFTKQGFEVIRFAERQIINNPIECVNVLKEVMAKLKKCNTHITFPSDFCIQKWTKEEASQMAREKNRNSYIGKFDNLEIQKKIIENSSKEKFSEYFKEKDSEKLYNIGMNYFGGVNGFPLDYKKSVKLLKKSAEQGYDIAQFWLGGCYQYGKGVARSFTKAVFWFSKSAEQGCQSATNALHVDDYLLFDSKTITQWYKALAEYGYADAQFKLANCYYEGSDISKNLEKAFEWYSKSAEQGYSDAQYCLGNLYYLGDGVPKDVSKAVKWFSKSAEQGNVDAQVNLGRCYYDNKSDLRGIKKALDLWRNAAQKGNSQALYCIGRCYYDGKKYKEAIKFWTVSAEHGNTDAIYSMGNCYYWGEGVSKDLRTAAKWYLKSMFFGRNAEAAYRYGNCCYYGFKDYDLAARHYEKAAKQGHAGAQYCLGKCYEKGEGVERDFKVAVRWYRKSAEQGYVDAQYCLGICYFYGQGAKQDYEKGIKWYEKAAEQENSDAQYELGHCYYNGKGIVQNLVKAIQWYTRSAEHGNAKAQYCLGNCYFNGEGANQDFEKAAMWYQKAAEQDHIEAQKCLSRCYKDGKGVKQDDEKYREWLSKALKLQQQENEQYIQSMKNFFVLSDGDFILT